MQSCNVLLQQSLSSATEEDLIKAAEAIVDAAICCYSAQQGDGTGTAPEIAPETRQMLISAVLRNPILTPHLFNKQVLEVLNYS